MNNEDAARHAAQRGDDRQRHRQDGAEGDEQDDHGGDQAVDLGGIFELAEDVSTQLDLKALHVDFPPDVFDRLGVVGVGLFVAV